MPASAQNGQPVRLTYGDVPTVCRRVWLDDLRVPADVDVAALLTDLDEVRLLLPSAGGDVVQLEVDGYYVEACCRVCECTDSNGCGDGCWWVQPDLCSSCAETAELVDPRPMRTVVPQAALL